MTGVVLTVVAIWLVLSVLASAACALVARGGLEEDRLHTRLHDSLGETEPNVPRPRAPAG